MTIEETKKKVLNDYKWKPWLERPFQAFMLSIFDGGTGKKSFKKAGVTDWQIEATIFSDGRFFVSDDVYEKVRPQVEKWMKSHHISEITNRLNDFYKKKKSRILKLALNPEVDTEKKLKEVYQIITEASTYLWIVHILEYFMVPVLEKETAKYIKGDRAKFIRDASYPEKKNVLEEMEDEIRAGADYKYLAKKYGWMRGRDGFARPYTVKEILDHAETIKPKIAHKYPLIPKQLIRIFKEARELVYFRTLRSDVLYELFHLARPIFKAVGRKNKLSFNDLRFYTIESLINKKPHKYPKFLGYIVYRDKAYYFEKSFMGNEQVEKQTEIKGAIAQMGIVRGRARVIMNVGELNKMKKGEILVTYMTSPNFLPAMKLASGFVTNEGGLTCHAAIVAREMKKPCVIATKIATKVIKDGDLIEVDANKGIVKILNNK